MRLIPLCLSLSFCTLLSLSSWANAPTQAAPLPHLEDFAAPYRSASAQLIGAALADREGWQKLRYLTTQIGHRLSGSVQLEKAVAWVHQQMQQEGLENVRLQPVKVPHWVRGAESARLTAPYSKDLPMLGLGRSVGTAKGGITAPVVVVRSFAELEDLGRAAVKGKIVVYNMPWQGYSQTYVYRNKGPARAAQLGAVGALVRSLTGNSLATPHTGGTRYDAGGPQIPAAAITVEDAQLLQNLQDQGVTPQIQLTMSAKTLPDADSHNVMAELRGREKPEEIVVLGGHLDSWDVGQGAHDDATGVVAAWQALRLMQQLNLRPRRTVRVVAWTNEENGLRGGKAYRNVWGQKQRHVAALEMDNGAEKPIGFAYTIPPRKGAELESARAEAQLKALGALLRPLEAQGMESGGGGADIGPLLQDGVPILGLKTVRHHYFDWHHTEADTLDKVDPQDFRRCIAALAVMAYALAETPEPIFAP